MSDETKIAPAPVGEDNRINGEYADNRRKLVLTTYIDGQPLAAIEYDAARLDALI